VVLVRTSGVRRVVVGERDVRAPGPPGERGERGERREREKREK
jgi:hypothetical protein